MKSQKQKNHLRTKTTVPSDNGLAAVKLPFIEHVYELRRRLFYIALSVLSFGVFGYFIQQYLVHFLLAPAKSQRFIYTSPGGGLNFLFQVCIYFGFVLSIPMIIYQLLRYIEPLLQTRTKHLVARYSIISAILAVLGCVFGYFVGLPVALGFLSHQFTTTQIQPLLTIQDYMSFVTAYLLGAALLFQLPLILLFINRIKPLSPQKLFGFERYLILIAFVAAAIMTPTPDIFNQLLFAGPIIATYQIGIVLVYLRNKKSSSRSKPQPQAEAIPVDSKPAKTFQSAGQAYGASVYPTAPRPPRSLPKLRPVYPSAASRRLSSPLLPHQQVFDIILPPP